MLVRMKTTIAGPFGCCHADNVLDVPDSFGKHLVESFYADEISETDLKEGEEVRKLSQAPDSGRKPKKITVSRGVDKVEG